jgi:hypothetical protein
MVTARKWERQQLPAPASPLLPHHRLFWCGARKSFIDSLFASRAALHPLKSDCNFFFVNKTELFYPSFWERGFFLFGANHETKSDQGPMWVAGFVFASLISALPTRCLAQDAVIEALKNKWPKCRANEKNGATDRAAGAGKVRSGRSRCGGAADAAPCARNGNEGAPLTCIDNNENDNRFIQAVCHGNGFQRFSHFDSFDAHGWLRGGA